MSINFFSAMLLTLSAGILTLNERKAVKISLAKDGWKRRTRPSWFLYSDTTRYWANQMPAYIYVILCVFETAGTDCDIVYYQYNYRKINNDDCKKMTPIFTKRTHLSIYYFLWYLFRMWDCSECGTFLFFVFHFLDITGTVLGPPR
jgi:hypothetical protein